jgi:hypothetical protein
MKRIVPFVPAALLCAACVVLSVRLHRERAACRLLNEGMEQLRIAHAHLAAAESCRREELRLNGSRLAMQMEVSDSSRRTSELNEALKEAFTLVFYCSESHCDLCIDAELKNLGKMAGSMGRMPVIILLHTASERSFRKFVVEKNANCPAYKTKERPAPLAGLERPCYFILEKASGRMISVFVPQKEDPLATESYLEQAGGKQV